MIVIIILKDERQRRRIIGKDLGPTPVEEPMRTLEAPTVDTQVQELLKKIISQEREEAPSTTSYTSFTTSESLSASASLSLDRDRERTAGFPSPPHSMPASLHDLPLSNNPDLIYDRRVPSSRDRDGHHRGDEEAELDEDEETSNRTPVQMPDPDVNEAIVLSQVNTLPFSSEIELKLKNI